MKLTAQHCPHPVSLSLSLSLSLSSRLMSAVQNWYPSNIDNQYISSLINVPIGDIPYGLTSISMLGFFYTAVQILLYLGPNFHNFQCWNFFLHSSTNFIVFRAEFSQFSMLGFFLHSSANCIVFRAEFSQLSKSDPSLYRLTRFLNVASKHSLSDCVAVTLNC
jgi:hypothetical protein